MDSQNTFDILSWHPRSGKDMLLAEVTEKGFANPVTTPAGIRFRAAGPRSGGANLQLRGASRVLARIGSFMAFTGAT